MSSRRANASPEPAYRVPVSTHPLAAMAAREKECPSCALPVEADAEECPYCQYEFPVQKPLLPYVAVAMALLLLGWLIGC